MEVHPRLPATTLSRVIGPTPPPLIASVLIELITSAIKRCRISGDLCRLSVSFKSSSPLTDPPILRISISDTGVGSYAEEFQDMKYISDSLLNMIKDGVISIATTSKCDNKIFHYNIDLKQKDRMKRVAKLPLTSKNGATFSGTEVSFSTFHSVDELLADITFFFRKKVGIELIVDKGGFPEQQAVNVVVVNECIDLPSEENAACLQSGAVDYVLKHGNQVDSTCNSCFPVREHLKTGTGVVFKSTKIAETTIEVVMLIMTVPKVGIELIVDKGGFPEQQSVNVVVVNECIDLPSEENAACLQAGAVDYVLKHGNQVDSTCNSCFPIREHLKTGTGVVCKSTKIAETTIEVVVIISELSELMNPSCFRVCGSKTEVLYFSDFLLSPISQSLLDALKSIDWKCYGISIKRISDEDGCAFIEWEDLPPAKASTLDRNLVKKAVKLALSDIKEKNDGFLLSANAVK
nr:type 2 DNA topoisomerase 6 subunit B-like [Tanacetum cinerariifolium]